MMHIADYINEEKEWEGKEEKVVRKETVDTERGDQGEEREHNVPCSQYLILQIDVYGGNN